MTRALVLGANGQLARNTTKFFLERTDARLAFYLRRASRLHNPDPARVTIVEGDVLDRKALVAIMTTTSLTRLVFISSMGIYDEVPGEKHRSVLDPYRDSAAVIEASDLDYIILRPGWGRRDRLPAHAVGRAVSRTRRVVQQPVRSDRETGAVAHDGGAAQPGPESDVRLPRPGPLALTLHGARSALWPRVGSVARLSRPPAKATVPAHLK